MNNSRVVRVEDFGIPDVARVPDPPEGADYAAIAEVLAEGELLGYLLVVVRTWTTYPGLLRRLLRGETKTSMQMPEAFLEWRAPRNGVGFEDGILFQEEGQDDYDLLRNGRLTWSGSIYDLRWIAWPKSRPIFDRLLR